MLFNLVLLKLIFYHIFFFIFLTYWLIFSIPAVISQFFNPNAELVSTIGKPNKEEKAEMKTHSVTAEVKISKFSMQFKTVQFLFYFLLINSFWFLSSMK